MTHNTSLKQDWSVFKNKQINHRQQSNDLNLVMNAASNISLKHKEDTWKADSRIIVLFSNI